MAHHDVVALGASAGGSRALLELVRGLPADLPAALLVTVHLPADATSMLPDLLTRAGHLPAAFVEDGETIVPGRIYVAPPDLHLLAHGKRLLLRRGPMENGSRPAIDPMFRSVAASFDSRVIGVILTGYLSDGSSGLHAIKRCGGIAIVQDPNDAEFPDMPRSALAATAVDHMVPLDHMPALLRRLVAQSAGERRDVPEDIRREVEIAAQRDSDIDAVTRLGERSVLTCPECHGVLWEIKDRELIRYRCHTGHAYSLDALAAAQKGGLDRALASALRALEERVLVLRRLEAEAQRQQHAGLAKQWARRVREYEQQASVIRNVMLAAPTDNGQPDATEAESETDDDRRRRARTGLPP